MKYFKICILSGMLAVMSGCSYRGDGPDNPAEEKVMARIVGSVMPDTRVSGTSFETDDKIGVFCSANENGTPLADSDPMSNYRNVVYKYSQDGRFVWDMTDPSVDRTDPTQHDILFETSDVKLFSAYYPFKHPLLPNGNFLVETDLKDCQTTENRKNIDILYAVGAPGSKGDPEISFTGEHAFNHAMAFVNLEFIPVLNTESGELDVETFSASDARDMVNNVQAVCIKNIHPKAEFNPRTGEFDLSVSQKGNIDLINIGCGLAPVTTGTVLKRFAFYVFPQETDISFTFQAGPSDFGFYETAPVRVKWESGKRYIYRIKIYKHNTLVTASIKPWDNGGSTTLGKES